jgi:hypothetical protein
MIKRDRKFAGALLMLCLSLTADAAEKQGTITLTDSKKIADAMALNEAIDQVSKKVMQCTAKKLAPQEKCFCLYPAEVGRVKEKYEIALKNNPEWRDKIVFWTVKGNPTSYNLAFSGVRRQLEMKCEK